MSETNNPDLLLSQDPSLDLPVEPLTVKLEDIKQEDCGEDFEPVKPLFVLIHDLKKQIPDTSLIEKPGCSTWNDQPAAGPSGSLRKVQSDQIKSEKPDPDFDHGTSNKEEDSLPDEKRFLDGEDLSSSIKSEPEDFDMKTEAELDMKTKEDLDMKTEEELKQEEVILDDGSSGAQRPAITSLDNPPSFKRKVGVHINYKCEICGYQTRFKPHYRSHLLKHKKPEEIEWQQCPLCSHKTKTKANLNTHLGTHKATDKIYRCTECEYKTKYRKTYNRHLLDHGIVKVDRFECPYCDYETPNKYTLEMHVVIHKDETETDIFYCPHCPYKAKRKRDLRIHSIRHKSTDEIKMFKCPDCDYHSKRKADLKSHALKHKSSDEIEILQCPFCPYQTKYKNAFKTHMGRHQNPDEVELFYCDNCEYKTRFKSYLKKHRFFKHKTEEKVTGDAQETNQEAHIVEPPLSQMFKKPQFVKVEESQFGGS